MHRSVCENTKKARLFDVSTLYYVVGVFCFHPWRRKSPAFEVFFCIVRSWHTVNFFFLDPWSRLGHLRFGCRVCCCVVCVTGDRVSTGRCSLFLYNLLSHIGNTVSYGPHETWRALLYWVCALQWFKMLKYEDCMKWHYACSLGAFHAVRD